MGIFKNKKFKVIVSDFHLGKGRRSPDGSTNLLEDFDTDREFIALMDYYLKDTFKNTHVELVLNGDFFNLLQIDYRNRFTDFITEADALHKTMSILHGHRELFDKLAEFSQSPNHQVVFILGNHDPGLLWPGVQEVLRKRLQGEVAFHMESYEEGGVYIEHGNQYYADNRYDRSQYFLSKKLPEPIINLPFGSFFIIHYLNEIKKERPYFDKIYPMRAYYRWAFIHDTWFAIKAILKFILFFFWFHLKPNPTKKINLIQSLQIIKEAPIHPKLDREAKRILFSKEDIHIVVFGHTHACMHRQFSPGKDYFNTGTWNERISLELGSLGRAKRLTYVHIDQEEGKPPQGFLREWKGKSDVFAEVF